MSKIVVVIGGGPAGMMAAWHLSESCEVKLFEKGPQLGRKFLLAGRGGLNITHLADREELKRAYSPIGVMDKVLDYFDQAAFRDWLIHLGIPTYEGTSGKVFPEKGNDVALILKKITDSLLQRGVTIYLNHRLIRFTDDISLGYAKDTAIGNTDDILTGFTDVIATGNKTNLRFTFDVHESGQEEHRTMHYDADFAILALGGASWPLTGSDGKWVEILQQNGISTIPFQPSNCGVNINWPDSVREFHTGKPLKNLVISVEKADKSALTANVESKMPVVRSVADQYNISGSDHNTTSKGEALITDYGLEGTAIYPLIPQVRLMLNNKENLTLSIDFKPNNTSFQLIEKIVAKKTSSFGKALTLDSAQMAVIKAFTAKEEFIDARRFITKVKKLTIPVQSLRPVEEAISVVGGIDITDLADDFSLRRFPNIYTIGEMVNWDAPTGGYLLQGCFSMGKYVADIIKSKPHF